MEGRTKFKILQLLREATNNSLGGGGATMNTRCWPSIKFLAESIWTKFGYWTKERYIYCSDGSTMGHLTEFFLSPPFTVNNPLQRYE